MVLLQLRQAIKDNQLHVIVARVGEKLRICLRARTHGGRGGGEGDEGPGSLVGDGLRLAAEELEQATNESRLLGGISSAGLE